MHLPSHRSAMGHALRGRRKAREPANEENGLWTSQDFEKLHTRESVCQEEKSLDSVPRVHRAGFTHNRSIAQRRQSCRASTVTRFNRVKTPWSVRQKLTYKPRLLAFGGDRSTRARRERVRVQCVPLVERPVHARAERTYRGIPPVPSFHDLPTRARRERFE